MFLRGVLVTIFKLFSLCFEVNCVLYRNPGNTTLNWKTSYNAVAEDTLSRDRTKSERPLWSLPREAYSSKRSYH